MFTKDSPKRIYTFMATQKLFFKEIISNKGFQRSQNRDCSVKHCAHEVKPLPAMPALHLSAL